MAEPLPSAVAAFHADNPAALLARVFRRIARERMAGLPICNPALQVAVVGMAAHAGDWLGGLVTPWALSLVILPGPGGCFRPLRIGESQDWCFASGVYAFLGHAEPELGHYQSCSLFSPVFQFADQGEAEAVAGAALAALQQTADAVAESGERAEAARLGGTAVGREPLSRRAFLRGGLFGGRG